MRDYNTDMTSSSPCKFMDMNDDSIGIMALQRHLFY